MKNLFKALAGLVAVSAFSCAGVVAAHADTPCTITNFRPRSTTIGLTPYTVTFGISTSGCDRQGWSLQGDGEFYVYDGSPQETFNPYDNSQAGSLDVIATADNADYDSRDRVFADGFYYLRRTAWQGGTFNATPEPARRGSSITIKGRLLIADWTRQTYVPYAGRTIAVQFRSPTGSFTTVKSVKTASDGWVTTTVPAKTTGVWRVAYGGNSGAGSAVSSGDSVQVVG